MKLTINDPKTGGYLLLLRDEEDFDRLYYSRDRDNKYFTIAWNSGPQQTVTIDGTAYDFLPDTVLTLMFNQSFYFEAASNIAAWQFNREFYCIMDHDVEVSCVGFLFGVTGHMFIQLDAAARQKMQLLMDVFVAEFNTADNIQHEMLTVLLKRLIIVITQLARSEYIPDKKLQDGRFDIIRKFNLLVEGNFCKEHSVAYYAVRLNKSPKTLSNLFALYSEQTPLQIIQERIVMEAKRLLYYTNQSVKQITFQLGFEDAAYFSNFFKRHTAVSPVDFRNSRELAPAGK